MNQKLKDILIVGLLVVTFVLVLLKLEHCKPINSPNITNSDTTIVYSSDTIWAKDTLYVYQKSPTLTDSFYIYEPDSTLCNYLREYQDTISDSNITIYTTDLVRGKLIESGLSYKLKVPIKIIDSVKTTITNTIEPTYNVSAGFILSKNNIAPMLSVSKKDVYLQVGYDIMNKGPVIGIGYRFYSK